MRRPRRCVRAGFTLVEMIVVLAILGVVAGVSVPAIRDLRAADPLAQATSETARLLARTRQTAVERAAAMRITLDPVSRRYRVRTLAGDAASDSVTADSLSLPDGVMFDKGAGRLTLSFAATGEARGDTIILRWQDRVATVAVDPWTGDAHVATH